MRYALTLTIILVASIAAFAARGLGLNPLPLPNGQVGIGFDDMGFAPSLRRVLVPAGRSGNLDLIDPDRLEVTVIGGFTSRGAYGGGHGQGVTSADAGRGLLFATDRNARKLTVVNPKSRSIVATAPLASGPDYVRFVAATDEVWVTEPGAQRIEIFSLPQERAPAHMGFISIPGGPESLLIDTKRGRAYTHLWSDTTLAIDLKTRKPVARWKNGCKDSRGIAIDDERGFLFVGCDEGKLSVLNLSTGAQLGHASSGDGVDIIAYNPELHHGYLPGEESATMAVIGISAKGEPTVLQTVKTARGSHCAAADDRGNVYICDPSAGRLLVLKDRFPQSQ